MEPTIIGALVLLAYVIGVLWGNSYSTKPDLKQNPTTERAKGYEAAEQHYRGIMQALQAELNRTARNLTAAEHRINAIEQQYCSKGHDYVLLKTENQASTWHCKNCGKLTTAYADKTDTTATYHIQKD